MKVNKIPKKISGSRESLIRQYDNLKEMHKLIDIPEFAVSPGVKIKGTIENQLGFIIDTIKSKSGYVYFTNENGSKIGKIEVNIV